MSALKGKRQFARTILADASSEIIWKILVNSGRLPEWASAVDAVEEHISSGEAVGSERQCAVNLNGCPGTMIERCVELIEHRSISYLVVDETFGMKRMFDDYGFRITLNPIQTNQTSIQIETFYTPKNLFSALLNRVIMRRQLTGVVDQLIAGLARLAEKDMHTDDGLVTKNR